MDDTCAVCAEALEWTAYGPCGHREVCSTCVVRLRFVLGDRRCCICKTECPCVFVTRAMGDYTRVITDFSVFPANATEGQVGSYWFHEDSQAYFDDIDHYKMIRAMCRLSCSVCDKSAEEQGGEGIAKRRNKFRSIEQLKGHLFHQHRLSMCSLCLEGRKVFICEQKLYTRSQLNRHINSGDSEVDGTESERGGFMGHPMCEFCKNPFYGDNELYMHMSTEHYTCHICQRQHPGQYDYYRNYDDLETHFRQGHFLCEDEACLAKKFVVFQTEAEMKRHNAIEHGGHMSRSKRNAALQIPTSFRYRRSEQEQRRGRGRNFRPEPSTNQLSAAIQASLETAMAEGRVRDSSSTDRRETTQTDSVTNSFESFNISANSRTGPVLEESSFPPLSDRDPVEPSSSRYAQALNQRYKGAATLGEESFPPLPGASDRKNKPNTDHGLENLAKGTLAAHLQQHRKASLTINSSRSKPSAYHENNPSISSSSQIRPVPFPELVSSSSSSSQPRVATNPARGNGFVSPPFSASSAWCSTTNNSSNRMKHSSSAPNLAEGGLKNQSTSSAVPSSTSSQVSLTGVEDVQTANKTLVERIRAALGMDEDRYAAFKSISAEYRQGLINTWEYLSYVEQFGLAHLILELARLLPDPQKQKELTEAYHASLRFKGLQQNGNDTLRKGKGKAVVGKGKGGDDGVARSKKDSMADNFLSSVRKLQSGQREQDVGEEEVLSKDGYRADKSKGPLGTNSGDYSGGGREPGPGSTSSNQKLDEGGSSKQRKKSSKFLRVRLGDGSAAALIDLANEKYNAEPPQTEDPNNPSDGSRVRGVWRNGGGQRLLANSHKDTSK
ncbi:E3 ubiquitin-protein ligase hel2 [Ananas comosus]|uniref:RING-type E3 ubiquitin transferase n=1 Tax=Ananas comosus TaxID=4615 RepID=A0A199W0J0_ANACO|nr:E3 ubiquitin-protein ligase hel2 [Ananas comosus]